MKNILIFLLIIPITLFSQKEDYVWMMGYTSLDGDTTFSTFSIDFNTNPITIEKRNQDFSYDLTNASICDKNGNLILHTNGVHIKNEEDEVILNGDEIQPSSSYSTGFPVSQAALFLPLPANDSLYYFFEGDAVFFWYQNQLRVGMSPLTYSIIDRGNQNGIEEVILKKEIILTDTLGPGEMTATLHGNGRDWWILAPHYDSNEYYKFLLSSSGVEYVGKTITGDSTETSLGQAVFSPDGRWYARYNWYGEVSSISYHQLDLYSFDRCEGELSNHIHELLPGQGTPGGVAFSSNSHYMYVSAWDTIYQYDMTVSDILASRTVVASYDGFLMQISNFEYPTRFYNMLLAPDEKIYLSVSNTSSDYLHVIDQPNEAGVACNVLQHEIKLPAFNDKSIPNLPFFRLHALVDSPCDTLRPLAQFSHLPDALEVAFQDESQRTPTEWLWTFGDGGSSTEQHPVYIYNTSGTYEVCLVASNEAGSDTTCQEVEIIVDGIQELSLAEQIKISPNPTSGHLAIELPHGRSEDWEMFFYDALGRVWLWEELPRGVDNVNVLLQDFPSGVYFYKIKSEERLIKVGKIIKE